LTLNTFQEVLGPVQVPTEHECAALHVPPLDALELGGFTFGQQVQLRLQRVWAALRMPGLSQLDMLIKYSSWDAADDIEVALDCWEAAAAAVLFRESVVQELVEVRGVGAGGSGRWGAVGGRWMSNTSRLAGSIARVPRVSVPACAALSDSAPVPE